MLLFQALDKCQLGDIVRAKEQRLEAPGSSSRRSVYQFGLETVYFVGLVYWKLRCFFDQSWNACSLYHLEHNT